MSAPASELLPGTWPSPLSPADMAAGTLRLSSARPGPGGEVYWLEGRPAEAGRTVLVRWRPDGAIEDLTPAPFDVRSRVHEYGGGAFALGEAGTLYIVNAADQAVYALAPGAPPLRLSPAAAGWRFGDLSFDGHHRRVLAVAERHLEGAPEPANSIVAIPLDGGEPVTLAAGADFYASPIASADGAALAYVTWNHPTMPWDAAAVHLADLDEAGRPVARRHIAGDPAASAQQPAFGPDGALYYLWEPEGYWNLFRSPRAGGAPQPLGPAAAELGLPPWQLGLRTWGLIDADTAVAAEIRAGVTHLVTLDLARGTRRELPVEVAAVAHLDAGAGGQAALVASFADRPSAVALLDAGAGTLRELRASSAGALAPEDVSWGQPFAFDTTDGDRASGIFYPPRNQRARAPAGARPPLLLLVHGGPTAAVSAAYSPPIQFWTTRGFAVLDLNYRGSTGHGRAYRDRLRGQWGVYDVADCRAAARALAAAGLVDAQRMVIRGSSAGGYTVLAALCADDTFHAGSSLYGISDLGALARDTHKFEAHYTDALVGPWPAAADVYAARSPLHQVDRLVRPVIFFQGLDDRVVPPAQTEMMVEALRSKQIPVEYHAFVGEQHGFRRADTLQAVYGAELSFFTRVLGLGR